MATRRDHNLAVHGLKESFRKATNLRPEFADKVRGIRGTLKRTGFRSKDVAETLRSMADANPQAAFSEADKSLLDRLADDGLHKLSADDVRAFSAHVESLVYQSAAKDRLIRNQESASVRNTADRIVREVAQSPRKEMRADSRFATGAQHEATQRGTTLERSGLKDGDSLQEW